MSICELWVARCAAAAIDSGFDLDLLSFGEERTFFSRDYDASMVHSVSLTFDMDSITVAPSEDGNVHLSCTVAIRRRTISALPMVFCR